MAAGRPAVWRGTFVTENLVQETHRWSTDGVRPQDALGYWVDTVCNFLLEMTIDSPSRKTFRGSLTQSRLGICDISDVDAESQNILRTSEMIGRSRYSDYRLLYFRRGGGLVSQRDRCATVTLGDCVLLDAAEVYSLNFPQPTACTVVGLPREWLQTWVRTPEALVARKLDVASGWGAALSATMRCISPDTLGQAGFPGSVLADQIAALLALAGSGRSPEQEAHRDPVLERLRDCLRERCHEQSLGPKIIAADQGISKRYLHMLFARAGTTFCDELMAVRLQRAHRMLADSRFSDMPIGEISFRCGFAEASHFARRFRQRFHASPSEFRNRQALA
jgi:AraC-like DNA-binding protein